MQLSDLKFAVLDDFFREGERYVADLEKAKTVKKAAKSKEVTATGKRLKGLQGNTLKDRDSW